MVLSPNDEEVANYSKNHAQFKTTVHKSYNLFETRKMVEIDTLFQTKTAKKNIPFVAAHTYIAYIRNYHYASETNKVQDTRANFKTTNLEIIAVAVCGLAISRLIGLLLAKQ